MGGAYFRVWCLLSRVLIFEDIRYFSMLHDYSYLPNKRAGPNKRAAWTNFEILITVQGGITQNDQT